MKGTHGTCRTFADGIVKDGFRHFAKGRRGSGVYFWAYDSQDFYARQLALEWWDYARGKGQYKNASDSRCAIIYVKLQDDGNYLDLEELETKESFIKGFNELFNRLVQHKSRSKAAQVVYDLIIGEMEKKRGCSFDIVHVRVYPPKDRPRYDIELTGHPTCYIVRNVGCILIERVETRL